MRKKRAKAPYRTTTPPRVSMKAWRALWAVNTLTRGWYDLAVLNLAPEISQLARAGLVEIHVVMTAAGRAMVIPMDKAMEAKDRRPR